MKRGRFSEEQIIGILKQHEAGRKVPELAREIGVSEATIYTWKSKYGGMEVSDAQKLKALEDENRRLKHQHLYAVAIVYTDASTFAILNDVPIRYCV